MSILVHLGYAGRVRVKANEIPSKTADCVVSMGAINRLAQKVSLFSRMLGDLT